MRLSVYVILMFSLAFAAYLMGFRSPALQQSALEQLGAQQHENTGGSSDFLSYDNVINSLIRGITSGTTINAILDPATLLTGVIVGAALLLSGFSAIYILAAIMLVIFMNVMVFPTSFLLTPEMVGAAGIGAFFALPLKILFNILLILAVLSFTRGGGI